MTVLAGSLANLYDVHNILHQLRIFVMEGTWELLRFRAFSGIKGQILPRGSIRAELADALEMWTILSLENCRSSMKF